MTEGVGHLVDGAAIFGAAVCFAVAGLALVRHRFAARQRTLTPLLFAGVTLLFGLTALSLVLADGPTSMPPTVWMRSAAMLTLLAASGVALALHRVRPHRYWAWVATFAVVTAAATPFVPRFGPHEFGDVIWTPWLVEAIVMTELAFVGGAVALVRAARSAPELARLHTQLAAAGLGLYAIGFPLGAWAYAIDPTTPALPALTFWLLLAPVSVALSPPGPVRLLLRRRAAAAHHDGMRRLRFTTTRAEALAAIMPALVDAWGASTLVLLDGDGEIEWAAGLDGVGRERLTSGLPPGRALCPDASCLPVVLRLSQGTLIAVPHALTPYNGVIEEEHLDAMAVEVDVALLAADRLTALAGERRARQRLEDRHSQLDADNAALRAYGRAIAHDIKTPLTVIRGAAETVAAMEDLSPAGHDLLQRVIAHSDRVAGLIDEQLSAATDATATRPVPLERVCTWLRATVADELAETGSTLSWTEALPTVVTNEGLLQRVLLNLVRNALQHATGKGPITIWVHGGTDGTVLVTDNGTGMTEADAARIFEPGVRLDRRGAGGLGLADSRAALRRIGGDLRVLDTQPGTGTTMAIVLPAAGQERPRRSGTAADTAGHLHV